MYVCRERLIICRLADEDLDTNSALAFSTVIVLITPRNQPEQASHVIRKSRSAHKHECSQTHNSTLGISFFIRCIPDISCLLLQPRRGKILIKSSCLDSSAGFSVG